MFHTFFGVPISSEFVTVNDAINSAINKNVHAQVQIAPCPVVSVAVTLKLLPLHYLTLWDARVFNNRLNEHNCIILKIIHNPNIGYNR